tara:strand:+ start:2280 stop:2966 length:687 start_codon:yes stop_codon:yes gene_type:complete
LEKSQDNLILTDVMIILHNALNNEGKKVQRIVEDLHEGSSLQEFQLSFNSWASILMYHADVEDENMTSILTDFSLARDNEAEHLELKELSESLNEYLDNHSVDNLERNAKSAIIALEHHQHLELIEALNDVLDVLNNEIGKTKLVARTIRHLYAKIVNLRTSQEDHFESEEALVLPEVEARLSIEDKKKLIGKLLIDHESEDPNWLINWLFENVGQNNRDTISKALAL